MKHQLTAAEYAALQQFMQHQQKKQQQQQPQLQQPAQPAKPKKQPLMDGLAWVMLLAVVGIWVLAWAGEAIQ